MKRTTRKLDTIRSHLSDAIGDISDEIKNSPDEMYRKLHAEYIALYDAYEVISKVMLERYKEGR